VLLFMQNFLYYLVELKGIVVWRLFYGRFLDFLIVRKVYLF